jgi:hypothetical protein
MPVPAASGVYALNEPLATDLPIFLTDTGYLKLDERARFRKAGDFRNWHKADVLKASPDVRFWA